MFADNERISWLQVRCQLLLTGLGVGLLWGIVPFANREGFFAIVAGTLGMSLWSGILRRQMTVFQNPEKYMGKVPAWMLLGVWESYLLLTGGWLIVQVTNLLQRYLISGMQGEWIALFLVLAALGGAHHIQARGRMAQVAWPVIGWIVGILLLFAAVSSGVRGEGIASVFSEKTELSLGGILNQTIHYLAYASGISLLMLLEIQVNAKEKNHGRGAAKAVGELGLWFFCGALILYWNRCDHLLDVMAGVELPGGFLRRVDLIFLTVLLFSLLFTLGSIFFYSGYAARRVGISLGRWPSAVLCFWLGTIGEQQWRWSNAYPKMLRMIFFPVFLIITGCAAWARRRSYEKK